ncbi:MAG: hypothetical protein GF419_02120 [Ignavibacteriales bacterium]|nr:hypothetical protein [Ignavibacteriales bacterium]
MEGILVPIAMFVGVAATIIAYFYYRNRERTVLAERGFSAEELERLYKLNKPGDGGRKLMVAGVVFIAFSIGLLGGFATKHMLDGNLMAVSIFLFTGLGFIVASKIPRRNGENDAE